MFDEPRDYVRLPQISQPDRPPVHGLVDRSGDRRAWTIEVQLHGDVPVPPERLVRVLLNQRDQYWELPAAYRRLAVVPEDGERDFSMRITDEVLAHVGAGE